MKDLSLWKIQEMSRGFPGNRMHGKFRRDVCEVVDKRACHVEYYVSHAVLCRMLWRSFSLIQIRCNYVRPHIDE